MGTQLPQCNICCCGCTLRFGSLIVFWLYLISGVLWMCSPSISGGYKTNSTVSIVGNTTNTIYESSNNVYGKLASFDFADYYPDFGWFAVALGAIIILIAGFGLYGTYKDQHEYMKPFLIWEFLDVLIVLIGCINHILTRGFFIFPIIYVGICVYFWLVIFTHYRFLKGVSTQTT